MNDLYQMDDKLSYVIANDYRLLQVMSRFGITLGFGEKSIKEVCRERGVDADTFLLVINYVKQGAPDKPQKVDNVNLSALLAYLKRTHDYFLDYLFSNIRFHLLNAIDCSMANEVAFLLLKFYDAYVEEVRKHMKGEEEGVYALVQRLLDGGEAEMESDRLLSRHHEDIEIKLRELKKLFIQYYKQKENNEKLNSAIINIYQAEEELSEHCLVEENIFVPAYRRLLHLTKNRMQKKVEEKIDSVIETEPLSEREKEIVANVAKGLSNKEIADLLCLSVNTVTTHRRNVARKLQIHSSSGLTIYAIVNKLVALEDIHM